MPTPVDVLYGPNTHGEAEGRRQPTHSFVDRLAQPLARPQLSSMPEEPAPIRQGNADLATHRSLDPPPCRLPRRRCRRRRTNITATSAARAVTGMASFPQTAFFMRAPPTWPPSTRMMRNQNARATLTPWRAKCTRASQSLSTRRHTGPVLRTACWNPHSRGARARPEWLPRIACSCYIKRAVVQ